MNVLRELANFFRQQAGIIFASQSRDPPLPTGVVAFWHNIVADKFRLQNAAGVIGDIATIAPVLDSSTEGAVALEHRFVIPAGPTSNIDFLVDDTEEIIDVILRKTGVAGGGDGDSTIRVVNPGAGADTPITDAMSINVAPGTIVRAQSIDDGANRIAGGGLLRFVRTRTASIDESVVAYVCALRRV